MALRVPEYLQSQKYRAISDRLALAHGGSIQEGVWDPNDFKASQRAAGANMSVDLAQGAALIQASEAGNAGMYHVLNDATLNVPVTASASTNPRIDQVVVQIHDSNEGNAVDDIPQAYSIPGTPSNGATLDNRNGAAVLPPSSILLADVLVPAGSTSVTAANIRDRRPWARGALFYSANIGTNAQTALGTYTPITQLARRVELTGVPVRLTCALSVSNTVVNGRTQVNFVTTNASASTVTAEINLGARLVLDSPTAGGWVSGTMNTLWVPPSPGSYVLSIAFATAGVGTSTLVSDGTYGPSFTVEEIVRSANSYNGAAG